MTSPLPSSSEAEYSRKLALGILSMLQQKGLLTTEEVDAILYTAHRAAQAPATPAPTPTKATPRGPLSDPQPQVRRVRPSLSDPPSGPFAAPLSTPAQTQPAASPRTATHVGLSTEEEAARIAEARWVSKETLPLPTFDIEL